MLGLAPLREALEKRQSKFSCSASLDPLVRDWKNLPLVSQDTASVAEKTSSRPSLCDHSDFEPSISPKAVKHQHKQIMAVTESPTTRRTSPFFIVYWENKRTGVVCVFNSWRFLPRTSPFLNVCTQREWQLSGNGSFCPGCVFAPGVGWVRPYFITGYRLCYLKS